MDAAQDRDGLRSSGERWASDHGSWSSNPRVSRVAERPGIAAGHERILNKGQQVLSVVTNEGHEAQALYQIAEVTRPLTAVGSTCDRGNVVIYGLHGGCILNLESGVQTDFARRGGIYELDLWMRTTPSGEDYQRDFPRLGR